MTAHLILQAKIWPDPQVPCEPVADYAGSGLNLIYFADLSAFVFPRRSSRAREVKVSENDSPIFALQKSGILRRLIRSAPYLDTLPFLP
jgi:hypothetical protein